ncbi:LytTR family DNA-binding domain-containing protein [Bacteroidia bacterium]|nr:LytTR family DNA-binding domain-containing protein [Bacteroidia bacterium]
MIKCVILEDDDLAAKSLIQIVSKIDKLDFQGHYVNPMEAKNKVNFSEIDLIFLDVEMPEITGIDLMKTLSNPPRVIVTTSKSDFAIGAFEIDAVDFILKPVEMPNVLKALDKYEKLDFQDTVDSDAEYIFVKVDAKLVNLKFDDILWLEALGDYVGFHVDDKRYVVKSTLSAIDKRIQLKNFVRVHRSFMVNIDHIKNIDDSSLVIQDKLIPVSRGNRTELINRLNLLK